MRRVRRLALICALGLVSCGADQRIGGQGQGGSSGDAGTSGNAGTTGTAGTTGAAGTSGTAGTSGAAGVTGAAGATGVAGSIGTRGTTNLFTTIGGRTQAEVDSKVTTAVNRFFGIGTSESATPTVATGYRCYYELPQDTSMAFIWAADSDDVRSEGMSYGMFVAVQMNLRTQFDRLWKFAKTYMQYPGNSGTSAWRYYFRWQGTVNRSNASSWTPSFGSTTVPAPDGDEYFAAALYLADKRWGSTGAVNYKQEADSIANAMLHNTATSDTRYPLIHTSQNMVVFVPYGTSNNFTNPSYHLPGFYELFALYGPAGDAARWRALATTSRNFLVSSANSTSGLHPDYATFAGAPTTAMAGDGHNDFRYDAWRVPLNMAIDYAWFSNSATMRAQVEKYHSTFTGHLTTNNVANSLFPVGGTGTPSGGGSTALTATLGAGALASNAPNRATYVSNLWGVAQQSGEYRYYQECVYLLGLLATAGKFNYAW